MKPLKGNLLELLFVSIDNQPFSIWKGALIDYYRSTSVSPRSKTCRECPLCGRPGHYSLGLTEASRHVLL